jgi:hypothetical protein
MRLMVSFEIQTLCQLPFPLQPTYKIAQGAIFPARDMHGACMQSLCLSYEVREICVTTAAAKMVSMRL